MDVSSWEAFGLWAAFTRQRRVLYALMLRNMRTKFFGNGFGMVVAVAWPLSHILILVALYTVIGRAPPYGESTTLFIATGVVPFQTFGYVARFMMLTVVRSRPLLTFPEVKVLDLLIASALLETLAAGCVLIVFISLFELVGIDVMPIDIAQACYAFGAAVLLGIGVGLTNGVIVLAIPAWFTGYTLFSILLWVTAGIFFVPDALPSLFRDALAYNPIVQDIEWTRSAYYEGYGSVILDRSYTVAFGVAAIFLGLVLERVTRGHILAWR